ncbi:MAG: hypothetical protein ACYDDC_02520, partial [Thermoplasmataceae archaeon]
AVSGYTSSPSSGSVTVNGASSGVSIAFTQDKYPVTFTESGLASGTSWSVTFNGQTTTSTSTTISFSVVDGTYSYTIGAVSGYTSSPSSGSVTVNGASQGVSIAFSASSSYPVGTYVIVNATSSNIQMYTLGEAEEFTVANTVTVNNVVMYLGGSGVVSFSIGTTLGGAQVVGTTNVNVGSSNAWIQVFFPHITLSSGTDYYLTVNLVSGSSEWGYTTSPSVDTGAIQDYWYSGSTLENDNSYPDIFSIGYNAHSTAAILGQMFSSEQYLGAFSSNIF